MPSKRRAPSDDDLGRLVRGRLTRPGEPAEVCPDAEILAAYIDRVLVTEEVERVDRHLASCAVCRATLTRLTPVAVGSGAALVWGRWPRVDPKWLSLAALVIVGASLWAMWPRPAPGDDQATTVARGAEQPMSAPEKARDSAAAANVPQAAIVPPAPAAEPAVQSRPPVGGPPRDTGRAAAKVVSGVPAEVTASAGARAEARGRAARPASPPAESKEQAADRLDKLRAAAGRRREEAAAEGAAQQRAALVTTAPVADTAKLNPARQTPAPLSVAAMGPAAANESADFVEAEGRLRWRLADGGRRIESSSDGGVSWNASYSDAKARLLSISAPRIGVTWAAGAGGLVIRRVSPGAWEPVTRPGDDDLVAIAAGSATSARATSRAGVVYETADGGATWTRR